MDSVKADYTPKSIRVGTDLSLIGLSIADPNISNFELNIDSEFYKYLLSFDYGFQSLSSSSNDFKYEHTGSYYRAGIDANFNYNDGYESVLFLGIRYAKSSFNETLNISTSDLVFGANNISFSNDNVRARWFEAVAGLKVAVWGNLYLGFTGRFKFEKKISSQTSFSTYEIPGYGKSSKNSKFAMNYQIFYKIPFVKKRHL